MTIPDDLQIFDRPVILTDKDSERLRGYLANWEVLAELLTVGVNEVDVQRLIILELMGKKRMKLLDRLLMRFGRLHRSRIAVRVHECVSKP